MKERHITYEATVVGKGHVTLGKMTETPAANRGNHDLVVEARDRRYFVRITGEGGWSLPEWAKGEALQVAQRQIEADEPLEA